MSTPSDKVKKGAFSSNTSSSHATSSSAASSSVASANDQKTTDVKSVLVPEKVMKLLYQYAEEAIVKEIQINSKAFKNYLRNRLTNNKISDENIELAIQTADYSQLQERYFKDGKLIAKESQKYSLTAHAKERMSTPSKENITFLFDKYSKEAKKQGIRNEKQCLAFLKKKIQPRNIQTKAVSDVIDEGKCQKLPGKRLEYSKNGLNVIVSKHDHSIITAFRHSTSQGKNAGTKTAASLKGSGTPSAGNKTAAGAPAKAPVKATVKK